jgi:hypothetical protein
MRLRGLSRHDEGAIEIGADRLAEPGHIGLQRRLHGRPHGGVVQEHVDTVDHGVDLLEQSHDIGFVGQIALEGVMLVRRIPSPPRRGRFAPHRRRSVDRRVRRTPPAWRGRRRLQHL